MIVFLGAPRFSGASAGSSVVGGVYILFCGFVVWILWGRSLFLPVLLYFAAVRVGGGALGLRWDLGVGFRLCRLGACFASCFGRLPWLASAGC